MTHPTSDQCIPLPEIYTRRMLNALYRQIPLKDTTFRLLRKYFIAAANLYGAVPVRKVFEIVNTHYEGLVSMEAFARFAEIACHECEEYYILGDSELYEGGRMVSILDTPNARQAGDGTFRLQQWPIKLWKAPISSPYYHHAHLLVCADCVAFSYANYHETLSVGRIPLICCPENEYDLTSHLSEIIKCNDIHSITVVRMDDSCCGDLIEFVKRAVRLSQKAIPVQATTIFIDCEIMD